MTYEDFNAFCGALPASTHVVQWGGAHVWKVGGKVFAIGGWERDGVPAVTFKTSESDYLFLSDQPGFQPAPYLASRGMKWIQCFDESAASTHDLTHYIQESHRIVSLGLTKRMQNKLGLNQ